jgi:hypothetical protein
MSPPVLALTATDHWVIAFSIATLIVLVGDAVARTIAPPRRVGEPAAESTPGESPGEPRSRRASRRRAHRRLARASALTGLFVGVAFIGALAVSQAERATAIVLAVGAAALAVTGALAVHVQRRDLLLAGAVGVAAVVTVGAGVTFGPTGVGVLDAILAASIIFGSALAYDGIASRGGLLWGIGVLVGGGVFALAGFGHQNALATLFAGVIGIALASSLLDPMGAASRGSRLAIGYALGVGALVVRPVPGAGRSVTTPLVLLALFLLDAVLVAGGRIRWRLPLLDRRPDHVNDRLEQRGWSLADTTVVLVTGELALALLALFCGRAVLRNWIGIGAAALLVLGLAAVAGRAHRPAVPTSGRRLLPMIVGLGVIAILAAAAPVAIASPTVYDDMQSGRDHAKAGIAAARAGDTDIALRDFERAADEFGRASDRLGSPLLTPSLAVPYLASNVRAARALAAVGKDLSNAGASVAAAIRPDRLEFVGGRFPLGELEPVTPQLEDGSRALTSALARLEPIRHDEYVLPPVQRAVNDVWHELRRADREARNSTAAARLAPALFGGDGARRYLLVVQNNAESRATGGFIGSYGVVTAQDGKLTVEPLLRSKSWNDALRALPDPKLTAPDDYLQRYSQYQPATTLQNVNLSPDFPSVARALISLAPQAGVAPVDGVIAIDPFGLAALLELTGAVEVEGWPVPISADNVVPITLNEAYIAFESTPERADFLGDVAQAAVDKMTDGNLGKPSNIANVLGAAAHEGHLIVAFTRPAEQRLAEQLGIAGELPPVRSDALAVTTSNFAANKIDWFLQRDISYRIRLDPESNAKRALAQATVTLVLQNAAPDQGLPQIIIGPFHNRFAAGENRAFVSFYSPLRSQSASINGETSAIATGVERDRNVSSVIADIPAGATDTISEDLAGRLRLHDRWYTLEVRHQPMLNEDKLHVEIELPAGWHIDGVSKVKPDGTRRATADLTLERTTTFRVRVARDTANASLWDRLEAGR